MKTQRCLLVLHWLACAASAQAACSRPVKVAISPMGRNMMVAPDGGVSGLAPDFLKLAAARTGCQFDFIKLPRARALRMLQTGSVQYAATITVRNTCAWWRRPAACRACR